METTLPCVKQMGFSGGSEDSQWEFAVWFRKLKRALYQSRGMGWAEDGREVHKGGDICICLADSDRVPDELWNEVRDIVQETGIKNIPMEKKCKKGKWLSEDTLQIAMKRREAKGKGEKIYSFECRVPKNSKKR